MSLKVEGKPVHTVGIPIHWGFMGIAKNGYLTNTLTPFVGDAAPRRRSSRRSGGR
jgi:formate dehydrogenase major subunit